MSRTLAEVSQSIRMAHLANQSGKIIKVEQMYGLYEVTLDNGYKFDTNQKLQVGDKVKIGTAPGGGISVKKLSSVQMPGRKDEGTWEKAKEAVDKEGKYEKGSETYWKVVETVYKDMGGT